ncbi:hypothetical protein K432DRAFT_383793 [Lepidopterella palustris CBS 459.81]|uniref:Uncharacterized protein n=1 Tax=Lepidopterella palustris CBS 459.81 TaxID=1314670 RepID=A0A8E2E7E4_9PEZI|nr:hypothetical protein K432DRAFT_383793 [Lepidopterella palustris CBS 459.81]
MAYHQRSAAKINTKTDVQVLPDAYIDSSKLAVRLKELFPAGDFKARHKNSCWMIQAPRQLSELEIESIYQQSSSA